MTEEVARHYAQSGGEDVVLGRILAGLKEAGKDIDH